MRSLAVVAVLAGTATAGPTAQTVLNDLQKHYAQVAQLTTDFVETVTHASMQMGPQVSQGRMWGLKPDRFRADYYAKGTTKVTKTFIFDGKTLWYINHQNKQIIQSSGSLQAIPAALSFLTGGANLASQFTVSLGAKGELVLMPKLANAQYAKIVFVIDANGDVVESTVFDPNGDTTDFVFKSASTTAAVQASWFQFNPASLPTYQVVAPAAPPQP